MLKTTRRGHPLRNRSTQGKNLCVVFGSGFGLEWFSGSRLGSICRPKLSLHVVHKAKIHNSKGKVALWVMNWGKGVRGCVWLCLVGLLVFVSRLFCVSGGDWCGGVCFWVVVGAVFVFGRWVVCLVAAGFGFGRGVSGRMGGFIGMRRGWIVGNWSDRLLLLLDAVR